MQSSSPRHQCARERHLKRAQHRVSARAIDPDALSPREALEALYRLKSLKT
jgi:hypothetical protein